MRSRLTIAVGPPRFELDALRRRLDCGLPAERSAVLMGGSQRWTYQLDFQNELLLPELAKLRDRLTASLGSDAFAGAAQLGATMELADVAGFLAVIEARTPA